MVTHTSFKKKKKKIKKDSLHKPWAPIFQMTIAVTVFLASGATTRTHTHTPTSQDEHFFFPTLAESTPYLAGTRAFVVDLLRTSTAAQSASPILLPAFFFLSTIVVCARTDQAQTSDEALAFVKTYCVRVCAPVVG